MAAFNQADDDRESDQRNDLQLKPHRTAILDGIEKGIGRVADECVFDQDRCELTIPEVDTTNTAGARNAHPKGGSLSQARF